MPLLVVHAGSKFYQALVVLKLFMAPPLRHRFAVRRPGGDRHPVAGFLSEIIK